MNSKHIKIISSELAISEKQVYNTLTLLDDGSTIPFISRYRKEMTGGLDEIKIIQVQELNKKLIEIDKRRETIINTIEEQGKLTPELKEKIEKATTLTELEDIYLPYKPKKKTKGSIAREKGLEPLAQIILKQEEKNIFIIAEKFLNEKVENIEAAMQGARDIIAEIINENEIVRKQLRYLFEREAVITSKVVKAKEEEGVKYKDYFKYSEPLKKCPSHRYLAILRGENENILKVKISPDEEKAIDLIKKIVIKSNNECSKQIEIAVKDSYKRLLEPSIENEFKTQYKEKADDEAIKVFAENLRQLLLAPPLGQKRVLAIDPGYRTGCKIVCLDELGNLLHNETIYPHPPQNEKAKSANKITSLVESYNIDAIAIGNGTASRETEQFIKLLRFTNPVQVFVVSESGASVYSASETAREEFPEYDVTVRGAISIGRRLIDPLAELVKIDPKSIGVGQYQHDVDQKKLKESLDRVVVSCVNLVGVNLNTASKHILSYISGLGPQLANNIIEYRNANGPFKSRYDLLKVKRMGDKAFEQCAGFLRIREGLNPLDNTSVHPESYHIVEKMSGDLGCSINELIKQNELRTKIDLKKYINEKIGLPTLQDIMNELAKPGLDPRSTIKIFEFGDVYTIEDVKPGMILPGIVTNITNFGAFVDIGVKQDGLVHISKMANKFIKDPNEIVKLHQHIKVKVIEVDIERKRINLSLIF
jgi:uncharacterized protein